MIDHDRVLIQPVLSEKANILREQGKYVFKVDPRANKMQIKEAVARLYNVHPISCNVMRVGGKPKRGRSRPGFRASYKKAIVRLSKDEKISIFEGV